MLFFDVHQPHRVVGSGLRPGGGGGGTRGGSKFVLDSNYLDASEVQDEAVMTRSLGVGAGSLIATKARESKDDISSFDLNKAIIDSCIGPSLSQLDQPMSKFICSLCIHSVSIKID